MTNNSSQKPTSGGSLRFMKGDHVGIRVSDFEAALDWYVEKLDFRVLRRLRLGELELAFLPPAADDAFKLEVFRRFAEDQGSEPDMKKPAWGWDHFCLSVEDVEVTLAVLRNRGVTIARGPFVVPETGQKIAFFTDPWGNTFEITGAATA